MKLTGKPKQLTFADCRVMLDKAVLMYSAFDDLEWKCRWTLIRVRILQAMNNKVIFFR